MGSDSGAVDTKMLNYERELFAQLMGIISAENNTRQLMQKMAELLRKWSDCQAAGIRLRDGDDYPYYESRGFPQEFVQAENSLCHRDQEGKPLRDDSGRPVLACMCGNVIQGRFDPGLPFFTEFGSFWTNSTSKLLDTAGAAGHLGRTRNRCHGQGYESVALIPLRTDGITFGLIQLNDRRQNRFSPDLISLLERLAVSVALALAHRKLHDALARSENTARVLLNAPGDSMLLLGIEGRILDINRIGAQRLGQPVAAVKDKLIYQFLAADAGEALQKALQQVFRTGKELQFDYIRDGRHYEHRIYPIGDRNGQIDRAAILVRDLTERKKLERERRLNNERFELALAGADLGLWDEDLLTGAVTYDQRWAQMLGYSLDEVESDTKFYEGLIHPTDKPAVLKRWNDYISGREDIFEAEHRLKTKSGAWKWILTRGKIVKRDAAAAPLRATGTHLDINDRKLAQARLESERQRFFSLLEWLPGMVYLQGRDHSIHFANREFRKRFGEIAGRPCFEILHNRGEPCRDCPTANIFDTKAPGEWERRRPDGRTDQMFGYPFHDSDGTQLVLKLGIDITAQKAATEALQRKEEQLQQKAESLAELNVALKVMLEHCAKEKKTIEQKVILNIHQIVGPIIKRLKNERNLNQVSALCDILETNISGLTQSFSKTLAAISVKLTATETQVAELIRQGKSSREIADILHISDKGVAFHRNNLRRKLGLTHRKVNLQSYLISLNEIS